MSLFSYLDQLQNEAERLGVDLGAACERAGIAATTLQRWRNGDVSPRKATAEAVLAKIRELSKPADPPREAAA